jgi:uncharacterized membrane protein
VLIVVLKLTFVAAFIPIGYLAFSFHLAFDEVSDIDAAVRKSLLTVSCLLVLFPVATVEEVLILLKEGSLSFL